MRPISAISDNSNSCNGSRNLNYLKKSTSMFEIHYLNRKFVQPNNHVQKGLMHRFIQSKGNFSKILNALKFFKLKNVSQNLVKKLKSV